MERLIFPTHEPLGDFMAKMGVRLNLGAKAGFVLTKQPARGYLEGNETIFPVWVMRFSAKGRQWQIWRKSTKRLGYQGKECELSSGWIATGHGQLKHAVWADRNSLFLE